MLVLSKVCRVVVILSAGCTHSYLVVLPIALALRLQVEVIVGEGRRQLIVLVNRVLTVLGLTGLLPEHLALIQIAVRTCLLLKHHVLAQPTTILAVATRCLQFVLILVGQLLGSILEKARRRND